jgi:hypothetical protein
MKINLTLFPVKTGADSCWYAVDNKKYGAAAEERLTNLLVSDDRHTDTRLWCEGQRDWQRPSETSALAHLLLQTLPPIPSALPPIPEASRTTEKIKAAAPLGRYLARFFDRSLNTIFIGLVLFFIHHNVRMLHTQGNENNDRFYCAYITYLEAILVDSLKEVRLFIILRVAFFINTLIFISCVSPPE